MKILLFFISQLLCGIMLAQMHGHNWQFSDNKGLKFDGCTPVVITGACNSLAGEGSSAVSDNSGQLLFYTNSDKVWDKFHNVMPNGTIMNSSGSLSQVLIVKKPLSSSVYYIITTMIQGSGSSLRYHIVDMNLNSGLGDVLSANNTLNTATVTEQVAATYHSNGTDIWVMVHEYGTNNFLAYLVTASGISASPVVSSIGPSHVACTSNFNARGEIKFSPNGAKLAFNGNGVGTNNATNILCILDFNTTNGILSNPLDLPFCRGEFGLSFSPDNTKLYGGTWKAFSFTAGSYNHLYQFDLSSNTPSVIVNTRVILDSANNTYGSIKIGPDGKVYVARSGTNYLGVINSPNFAGVACNYVANGINLGSMCKFGLNNYIEYINYCNDMPTGTNDLSLYKSEVMVYPNPFSFTTIIESENSNNLLNDLVIYNINGQTVKTINNINSNKVEIKRENLLSGIYFYKITSKENVLYSGKLVIE